MKITDRWIVNEKAEKIGAIIRDHGDGLTVELTEGGNATTVPFETWEEVRAFVIGYEVAGEVAQWHR